MEPINATQSASLKECLGQLQEEVTKLLKLLYESEYGSFTWLLAIERQAAELHELLDKAGLIKSSKAKTPSFPPPLPKQIWREKVWLTFLAIAANPKFNEPHAANPTLGAITLIQWAWFLTEVFENNIDDMKVLPEHLRGRQQ